MNSIRVALMVAILFLFIHAFLQVRTSEIVDGLEAGEDQLPVSGAARQGRSHSRAPILMPHRSESAVSPKRPTNLRKPAALEVTAFINVCWRWCRSCSSTAVFMRLSVMDRSLPAHRATSLSSSKANDLKLEVVIRPRRSKSVTASAGLIQRIQKKDGTTTSRR